MSSRTKLTNEQIIGATAGTILTSDVGGNVIWSSLPRKIVREIPTGDINGSNPTFTLAYTPETGSEEIYVNGILQNANNNDYSILGNVITFQTAPLTDFTILVSYSVSGFTFPSGGGASPLVEYRENYIVGTTANNYDGSTTGLTLVDSYLMTNKNLKIFYGGLFMTPGYDYTEVSTNEISWSSPRTVGVRVSATWSK